MKRLLASVVEIGHVASAQGIVIIASMIAHKEQMFEILCGQCGAKMTASAGRIVSATEPLVCSCGHDIREDGKKRLREVPPIR